MSNKYNNIFILSFLVSILAIQGFTIDFLKSNKQLLIFSAKWCGPCKTVQRWIREDVATRDLFEYYDVKKYDIDIDIDVAKRYNITQIPSFIIVQEDKEIARKIGIVGGKSEFETFLHKYQK